MSMRSKFGADDDRKERGSLVERKFKKIQEVYVSKKRLHVEAEIRFEKYIKEKHTDGNMWELDLSASDQERIDKIVKKEVEEEVVVWQDADKFYNYYFNLDIMWRNKRRKMLLDRDFEDARELEEIKEEKKAEFKQQIVKPLTIKLMLTNLPDDGTGALSHLKKHISRQVAKSISPYGLNHAALQIGPYIIDWNESAIIIPRWMSSANSTLLIPVREDDKAAIRFNALPKICKKLVEFNTQWKYSSLTYSASNKTCNCQDFVQKLMEWLECAPTWKKGGYIDTYIKKIKEGAIGEELKIWDMSEQGGGKEIVFSGHDALLEFWLSVRYSNRDPELVTLIKCIERVIQMRFEATGDDKWFIEEPIFGAATGVF